MSNSELISGTLLSPFCTAGRTNITKITPHHAVMVNASAMDIARVFQYKQASANYCLGNSGDIVLSVDEKNRPWTSSSSWNDNRAVTIEIANSGGEPDWKISAAAWDSLVNLCVDICKRNGMDELVFTGDETGSLTMHKMFAATRCPGEYLTEKMPQLAKEVTAKLANEDPKPEEQTIYRVQVGAFSSKENAQNFEKELESKGYDTYIIKVNNIYKVQAGAFSVKKNAESLCAKLKADGYDAFITENEVTQVIESDKKSNDEIANEVIQGKWGVGQDRVSRLEAAGYDYDEIQQIVNSKLD